MSGSSAEARRPTLDYEVAVRSSADLSRTLWVGAFFAA